MSPRGESVASTTENGAEAKPRVLEIVCSAHHVHVITSTSSSLSPSQICALEHSPPPISPPHAPSFACDYLKCQSLVWATAPPIDSTLRLDIDRMISIFAGTTLHKRCTIRRVVWYFGRGHCNSTAINDHDFRWSCALRHDVQVNIAHERPFVSHLYTHYIHLRTTTCFETTRVACRAPVNRRSRHAVIGSPLHQKYGVKFTSY